MSSIGSSFNTFSVLSNSLLSVEKAMENCTYNIGSKEDPSHVKTSVFLTSGTGPCGFYGLNVSDPIPLPDDTCKNALMNNNGGLAYNDVLCDAMSVIENVLAGPKNGCSSLLHSLEEVIKSMEAAAAEPTSIAKEEVIIALQRHLLKLNQLASKIQEIRQNADHDIAQKVNDINSILKKIADLNQQIASTCCSNPTAASTLKNQRNAMISNLASYLDIDVQENGDNITITSSGGSILLNNTTAYELSYEEASHVDEDTIFSPILVGGLPLLLSDKESGYIKGLLDIRDRYMVAIQKDLDHYAGFLEANMNRVDVSNRVDGGICEPEVDVPPVSANLIKDGAKARTIALDLSVVGVTGEHLCEQRDTRPFKHWIDTLRVNRYTFECARIDATGRVTTTALDYIEMLVADNILIFKNAKNDKKDLETQQKIIMQNIASKSGVNYQTELMSYYQLAQVRKFLLDALRLFREMQRELSSLVHG